LVLGPPSDPAIYVGLTFPALRPLLHAPGEEDVIAIGASIDGVPAGLLLATMIGHTEEAGGPTAKLRSLMVASPFRREGIGKALMGQLEVALREREIVGLFCVYSTRLPDRAALEATLAAAGWVKPRFRELRLAGECGKMVEAVATWPTVQDRLMNSARYAFTPWSEATGENDLAAIERLCAQRPCVMAPMIRPATWEPFCDPAITMAVRHNGALVGWVAAHRLERPAQAAPEVYYVSYLDEELQRSGAMVAAYFRAFHRQAEIYGDESIAHYSAVEPAMKAITLRRFAPIARWIDELWTSGKRLRATSA
jgi:GNAT superfamily N-acetyltransferase